jgi:cytochrome bd-type quinol oxidase subunit 2
MDITGVVAIISVFGIIPLIVFLVHRHKERQALIEKGMDISLLVGEKKCSTLQSLKFGILLIGLAIGILIGNILDSYTGLNEEVSYFSMIFLFGGLALLIFYALAKRQEEEIK